MNKDEISSGVNESSSISPSLPILTLGWVNEDFPVIFKDTDGNLTGIYVEMWKTWAKAEGYQLTFVQGDGYGGWNGGPNGWAGVLGLIANGTINGTLDKYSYRPGRYSAFRSSLPVLYSKDTFFDARSIEDGSMSIDFVVFPVLILILFVVSMIIVTLIERFLFILRLEIMNKRRTARNWKMKILYFWQDYIFLKPSITSFFEPRSVPLTSFSFYLLAMVVIINTYNAEFRGNSNVIVFKRTLLTDLVSALNSGSKALMVTSPSLIYDEQMMELYGTNVRNDSFRLQIEPNYEKMAVKVCDDERVIAYVPDYRLSTVDPSKPFRPPCDYVEVDASVAPPNLKTADSIKEEQPFVFYFHKKKFNRRHAEKFNEIILKLYDYDTIYSVHWRRWTNRPMKKIRSFVEIGNTPVTLSRVSIVFIGLFIADAASLLLFTFEIIYAILINRRRFSPFSSLRRLFTEDERIWRPSEEDDITVGRIEEIVGETLPRDKYEQCTIM
ncbi:hypothetical protein PRIPAC_90807 [Pristionchus pacificus]|uniref:Uncharacterized protein n=1 Tax=Pristionchus pacificus TaxID=54126 RepID=A0A2A6BZ64_PRIPA|nr:hypothetical protein PRIPAC_90807 [Pristionchus pacificus]|eukprot:PDM71136.1 hypothetical protein PRIPAC_43519 [Pristionchus pacificus]